MSQFFASGGQSIGSVTFSISPSNEHSGLVSFRMDWLDFPAVPGTLKSLFQHHSSKASVLWHSAFFIVQLSLKWCQFSSIQSLSCVRLFATPWTAAWQASLSITNSEIYPNLYPSCWWCHPAISSSVVPFFSCTQSFPASGSFQMSQLFASGGQSIGVSDSAPVLPVNIWDWFPLGWTGWISLLSKGLSRVFSNTTVQKHQFFST